MMVITWVLSPDLLSNLLAPAYMNQSRRDMFACRGDYELPVVCGCAIISTEVIQYFVKVFSQIAPVCHQKVPVTA